MASIWFKDVLAAKCPFSKSRAKRWGGAMLGCGVPVFSDVAALSRRDMAHDMALYGARRAATWCTSCCYMVHVMLLYGARQRYRRKRCGKTFNDLTHIPLAGKRIDDGKTVWMAAKQVI
jgi:hypothetical protein